MRTKNELLLENYENLDLQKLPEQLRKNGFDYELVVRTNSKLIYSQSLGGKVFAYEVFKNSVRPYKEFVLRKNPNCTYKALHEYKEFFPCDNDFGKRAWCKPDLESAMEKYNSLL